MPLLDNLINVSLWEDSAHYIVLLLLPLMLETTDTMTGGSKSEISVA